MRYLMYGLLMLFASCGQDANHLYSEGKAAREAGDYQAALRYLTASESLASDDKRLLAEIRKEIGNVHLLGFGQLEVARRWYEKSLLADPEYINAKHNLGLIAVKKYEAGEPKDPALLKEAESRFREVLSVQPRYLLSLQEAGKVQFYLKNYNAAITLLEKAANIDRKNGITPGILGQVHLIGTRDFSKAAAAFETALQLNPTSENAFLLAHACHMNREPDRAETFFTRGKELLVKEGASEETVREEEEKWTEIKKTRPPRR